MENNDLITKLMGNYLVRQQTIDAITQFILKNSRRSDEQAVHKLPMDFDCRKYGFDMPVIDYLDFINGNIVYHEISFSEIMAKSVLQCRKSIRFHPII